jgi:hypothetical protein
MDCPFRQSAIYGIARFHNRKKGDKNPARKAVRPLLFPWLNFTLPGLLAHLL